MTHPNSELHVYFRSIHANEKSSLSLLASHIPPRSVVLDLGCGSGALGEYLKKNCNCETDGVTLNQTEAAHAQKYYRQIEVANLETADLTSLFPSQSYDAIVCADVLEHLRQPERVLSACRKLLRPQGKLLLSVPNAAYCGLVAELMQGEFRYRNEGLLDNTHVRFFTRKSLCRFMAENQWALEPLEVVTRPVPDSEFSVAFDQLPPAVARYLLATADALTYQFIGAARPADASSTPPPLSSFEPAAQALFTAQLYLGRKGAYNEDEKITARGSMGNGRQTLAFDLPHANSDITELRLDPADRPGFLHLYGLRLRDASGMVRWSWAANTDSSSPLQQAPHDQITWSLPMATISDAALLLLYGDDPWLKLPIPPEALARSMETQGARLEADMGWPMSADYLALSSATRTLSEQIVHLEHMLSRWQRDAEAASAAAKHYEEAFTRTIPLQQQHAQLEASYAQLQDHVQRIEASTAYRATRPAVRAKMRIDQLLGRGARPLLPHPEPEVEPLSTEPAPEPAESSAPQPVASPHPAPAVDVVIPVYRGLKDTQRCLESVLTSTNETTIRLIVINDNSPEPELTHWLRAKAAADPRIQLLENESNQGFVGTVNRGMSVSDTHDILLLNSDTEVAGNWLDRLRAAAYATPNVATVTPFSNNATICSYPQFCASNTLPPGYTTEQLDAIFSSANPGAVLDIPTGVGFCMYIRRDCLSEIGMFDVENYGKGYGEENDFCIRAAKKGWRNLHALDTFVLHTGGISFGKTKGPRELAAMETLRRLHPEYEPAVQAFAASDPARPFREAIDLARLQAVPLPRILAVVHSLGGGTLRHVKELAAHVGSSAATILLIPIEDHNVRLHWLAENETMQRTFHWPTQSAELLEFLKTIRIEHVHFHHLLGLDPQMMKIPERLGVPYDFTVHDYYTACPQIAMADMHHAYCGEAGIAQCTACLKERPTPTQETIEEWRLRHKLFLSGARNVLAPSLDTGRRIVKYFPNAHVRLARHTDIPPNAQLPEPTPAIIAPHAHLRILVIGAVGELKGADTLEATAIEAAQHESPLEFHLVGYAHRALKTQPHASLTIHGAYQDEDLPSLLRRLKPDVVWFPAQWPETYSYTLSACLQAGVPIVAPDIGAFPERLQHRHWTWLMPWKASAHQWRLFFTDIRTQHFLTGKGPVGTPCYSATLADAKIESWSYEEDYLPHQAPTLPREQASSHVEDHAESHPK